MVRMPHHVKPPDARPAVRTGLCIARRLKRVGRSLALAGFCALAATVAPANPPPTGGSSVPPDTFRVAFVSDTQSPLLPELIALERNNNEGARGMIFDAIIAFRPRAVFHMGDLVALGFSESSWEAVDAFVDRLRPLDIGFYPILGNHELMLLWRTGESRFRDRFPYASKTGYLRRIGPMAVVLLNSNVGQLTVEEGERQLAWYRRTLKELDADSTVGLVVVGCHHSPYTNSTIVSPSKDAQELFVPPFLAATKTRLFLSGHAHAAEHFRRGGKDFLVIGGGGGLQQPLLTGDEARWPDHFPQKSKKRMFHYLECLLTDRSALFAVRMLREDFSAFYEAASVRMEFPPPSHGLFPGADASQKERRTGM